MTDLYILYTCLNITRLEPDMQNLRPTIFYDLGTRHEVCKLKSKDMTRLIKWIKLKLIYIILYSCISTT